MGVIRSKHAGADLWLEPLKPNPGGRVRLFCFPYAGGGAAIYQSWARRLPPSVEVWAGMLPGRGSRLLETPPTRISETVAHLARAIKPYLDKPFAVFGHSMGAFIGFDLARRIRGETGVEPVCLFVSGCRAPQLPDPEPPPYDLPDRELIAFLRRLNGTPEEMFAHPELMELLMPMLRADLEAVATYEYVGGQPLGCPIRAYGGVRDPRVSAERLAGWREHTTADFAQRMFEGDHFFIHQAEALVAGAVGRELSHLADATA
ncbi:MAG TPA: alpha/beta fold hydrolase [Pyrinomonadaceae bacterium]